MGVSHQPDSSLEADDVRLSNCDRLDALQVLGGSLDVARISALRSPDQIADLNVKGAENQAFILYPAAHAHSREGAVLPENSFVHIDETEIGVSIKGKPEPVPIPRRESHRLQIYGHVTARLLSIGQAPDLVINIERFVRKPPDADGVDESCQLAEAVMSPVRKVAEALGVSPEELLSGQHRLVE